MLELLRMAVEAVTAEHAWSGGVHQQKGCHGCVVFSRFRAYVLGVAQHYPHHEPVISASLDGKATFCIWVGGDLTHARWEMLCRYVALLEPDATTPKAAP